MEIIIALFSIVGLLLGIGLSLAVGSGGFVLVGYVFLLFLALAVRFWWLTLVIMAVILTPIFYLNGWLPYIGFAIALLVTLIYFTADEKEIERDKTELKAKRPTAQ